MNSFWWINPSLEDSWNYLVRSLSEAEVLLGILERFLKYFQFFVHDELILAYDLVDVLKFHRIYWEF